MNDFDFEQVKAIYDAEENKYHILCPHCLTWMHEPNRKYIHLIRRCPLCLNFLEVDYGQ